MSGSDYMFDSTCRRCGMLEYFCRCDEYSRLGRKGKKEPEKVKDKEGLIEFLEKLEGGKQNDN